MSRSLGKSTAKQMASSLPLGYDYGGILAEQTDVTDGVVYKAYTDDTDSTNHKYVLCNATKSWTEGDDNPDSDFEEKTAESISDKLENLSEEYSSGCINKSITATATSIANSVFEADDITKYNKVTVLFNTFSNVTNTSKTFMVSELLEAENYLIKTTVLGFVFIEGSILKAYKTDTLYINKVIFHN